MTLRGADPDTVRDAIATGDPLPGTAGFGGLIDGAVVRDVLGRELVYVDGDDWDFDPAALSDPSLLPAGCRSRDGSIERVWRLPASTPTDEPRAAVEQLRRALDRRLAALDDGAAVAFSGGVDSATVAAAVDAPLYVAGFPDSHDVTAAREAAAAMGREDDLRVVELTHELLRELVPAVARATGRSNAMDVGIAVPLFAVARRAAADGHDTLILGQGADELFGGYAKVAQAPEDSRTDADTVRGARDEVLAGLPDQAERDLRAVRSAGVEPVTPLLHDAIVRQALSLPGSLLVDERGTRKVALRLAARPWLPHAVAFRGKKAVQYGTDVATELDRLARRDGYKRRLGDHVSKWIASLL